LAQYCLTDIMSRIRFATHNYQGDSIASLRTELSRMLFSLRSKEMEFESSIICAKFDDVSVSQNEEVSPSNLQEKVELSVTELNENVGNRVYIDEAIERLKFYLQLSNTSKSSVDWNLKISKSNISVYSCQCKDSDWQAIKAVTVIKAKANLLVALLTNDLRIKDYDEMFDYFEFIEKIDDLTNIRRVCFKAVWPTAPRDFIICTTHQVQPDGSILIATMSVPDSVFPQQKGFVRGCIRVSGYHIQPYDSELKLENVMPGQCRVTLTAHTELGGTLPISVINMLSTNAPLKMLASVSEIMKNQT